MDKRHSTERCQDVESPTCESISPLVPSRDVRCSANGSMHREYKALNIGRIQDWISQGRFDPTKPLTIREAVSSGMIRGINRVNGIKLCGTVNEEKFGKLPPLTVHLSRFSKAAGEAIVEAGGTCVAVWHNDLALRQELNPWKFRGARAIKSAAPTRRKDIGEYKMAVRMWSKLS